MGRLCLIKKRNGQYSDNEYREILEPNKPGHAQLCNISSLQYLNPKALLNQTRNGPDLSKVLIKLQPPVASAVLFKRGVTHRRVFLFKLSLASLVKQWECGDIHQRSCPQLQTGLECGPGTGQRRRLAQVVRQRHTLECARLILGILCVLAIVLGVIGVGRLHLISL